METTKLTILLLAAFSLLTLSKSQAGKGQWKVLKQSIGISAMHMALLPNGRLVIFDRTDFGQSNISLNSTRCNAADCSAHSVEFDPLTLAVRPLTILTDTFCSSGALSRDGTLVQSGGYNDGDHAVRFLSPCASCDWVENKSGLAVRRWYASNQMLPDGRIIVVGGRRQFNYEFIPRSSSSVFDLPFLRETTDRWENNLYPFVHLSPDGNLFVFARTKGILLDYVRHRVVRTFVEIPGAAARNYPSTGSSVLLPLLLGRTDVKAEVMVCGGTVPTSNSMAMKGTFLPASSTCGRLVITDESPEWEIEEMPIGRVMGDMVLLPTGDVLVVNGAAKGSAGWGMGREPALRPVMYRTENRTFEVMNPSVIPRLYHSTAHLLPDGRVLVGGSNPNRRYEFTGVLYPTELSVEAFSPPYLETNSLRPSITSMEPGVEIEHGQRLAIDFMANIEGGDRVQVTMVAPSFNTHSFSMNQRVLVLEVKGVRWLAGRNYTVDGYAPAAATLAPPGYYMVFVLHNGVPSDGKWIRLGVKK